MAGKYFDEWQVGETIAHDIRRTVTETDNLLFSTMTRRLERLAHAMDEFKRTDFTTRPFISTDEEPQNRDEIDRLTANFRDLAERTATQLNNLKQTDDLRRELVANVQAFQSPSF